METAALLTKLMEQVVIGLNTFYPAKIVSFDINTQEATIQPLFQTKEYGQAPQTRPILEGVPVLNRRYQERTEGNVWGPMVESRMVLKTDDIVMCAVSQRSLDDIDNGKPYYAGKARILNMQDSVITGVIKYA